MRTYATSPHMFIDRLSTKVVQPDALLVSQLHQLLDLIESDNHALAIDQIVSELLKFNDPNIPGRFTPPELLIPSEATT